MLSDPIDSLFFVNLYSKGFERDHDGICGDIDECALNIFDCPITHQCSNIDGSYNCTCPIGFDEPNCTNIDECVGMAK